MTPPVSTSLAPTPIVRLEALSPRGVDVYAKLEWFLPTGSLKDRVAAAMMEKARSEGRITPGTKLLEPSSGNTGIAMARLAMLWGVSLTVVMPEGSSAERIETLKTFGTRILFSPQPEGANGAVRVAEEMAASGDYLMLHQYANPANVEAHYSGTGREIVTQLDRVDVLVAGLGTGGTLMGAGAAVRESFPRAQVVAAEPPVGELITGLRSMEAGYIPPIFDAGRLDRRVLVRLRPTIEHTRLLLTAEGLFAGPSCGAALAVALRVAREMRSGTVVTIFPDAGWKYLSTGIYTGPLDQSVEKASDQILW
ncbi:MAG: PLP-dependent cysteine synthase family protein [Acidimicrobiia bacterium]|nr:PLP-dependent cysteine synthase family protein [Acidimicrobiia bacterium]MYK55196.1 PLP-dependent cysteine synthase family protein [Acidimicrobiia bacterium]